MMHEPPRSVGESRVVTAATKKPSALVQQTGHCTSDFTPFRLSMTSGNLSVTNGELSHSKVFGTMCECNKGQFIQSIKKNRTNVIACSQVCRRKKKDADWLLSILHKIRVLWSIRLFKLHHCTLYPEREGKWLATQAVSLRQVETLYLIRLPGKTAEPQTNCCCKHAEKLTRSHHINVWRGLEGRNNTVTLYAYQKTSTAVDCECKEGKSIALGA